MQSDSGISFRSEDANWWPVDWIQPADLFSLAFMVSKNTELLPILENWDTLHKHLDFHLPWKTQIGQHWACISGWQ